MEKFSFASCCTRELPVAGAQGVTVGGRRKAGPSASDEVRHVMSSTQELTLLLVGHQIRLLLMVPSMRSGSSLVSL